MKNISHNKQFFIILFCLITYVIGFIFKDYTPTGAKDDFESFTWSVIQSFKNDLSGSIINFGKFADANYPLFYIFNAYLNPFAYSISSYHISTFFFAIITFIVFGIILIKKKIHINKLNCFALASTILILPFFAARSYWGTTASLGWISFVISIFYFLKVEENEKNKIQGDYITIFLFCLSSAITIYIRPSFVFFPIFFTFLIFLKKYSLYLKITSLVTFFFMSLPGFYLIYEWQGIIARDAREGVVFGNLIDFVYVVKNLPIISSIFLFYLAPIFIFKIFKGNFIELKKTYLKPFIFFFILMSLIYFFGFLEYLNNFTLGGGALLKLNYIIGKEFIIFFIIIASLGFSVIYDIFKECPKRNIPLILSIIIIYGFPKYLYQDYFEPLIFFIISIGLIESELSKFFRKNFLSMTNYYLVFFSLYSLSSYLFKNIKLFNYF